MRTGTADGRSEGRRSFLIRISRRSAFSCASTAARKCASRKTTTCARSSAPSAARICTGNIPSGRSAGKRRRARSVAGTAARKWSLRIHTIGVPYSAPKPAALNGIPIKRKQKHKPASAEEKRERPRQMAALFFLCPFLQNGRSFARIDSCSKICSMLSRQNAAEIFLSGGNLVIMKKMIRILESGTIWQEIRIR